MNLLLSIGIIVILHLHFNLLILIEYISFMLPIAINYLIEVVTPLLLLVRMIVKYPILNIS